MAKYTLEDIMCGEKYNIESDVFMEVFRLVEQKADAKTIREQLNTCVCDIDFRKRYV